jgi:hypothetical protein
MTFACFLAAWRIALEIVEGTVSYASAIWSKVQPQSPRSRAHSATVAAPRLPRFRFGGGPALTSTNCGV